MKKSFLWVIRFYRRTRRHSIQLFYSYKYYQSKRLAECCDIRCGIDYVGKKGVRFPHPIGVVIGIGVKLGNNCIIFQNTTIGTKTLFKEDYPVIGENVIIGANSIIIGDIIVGDNVTIGASSLVNIDLPNNAIAIGCPAKIIGYNKKD